MSWLKDKFLSRKFLAAVAAVAAAATGVIPWSDALNIVLLWITVQGLQDVVTAIPSGSREDK